jgi:hypothetical protein
MAFRPMRALEWVLRGGVGGIVLLIDNQIVQKCWEGLYGKMQV